MAKDNRKYSKKELYEKLSKGEFDSLSLQRLKQETDDISQGRREFERYSGNNRILSGTQSRLSEGMRRAGEIHQSAAIICRADESADRKEQPHSHGTGNEGKTNSTALSIWYEKQKEAGKRQEALLHQYAEAADCWYQIDNLDESLIIGMGGESIVYRYDEKTVLKLNTLRYTVSPQILLDRITIHNYLFPDTAMEVIGFGRNEFSEFCILYTQPYIQGTPATKEQIEKHIEKVGQNISQYQLDGINFRNQFFLFDDLHQENVLIDNSGGIRVIDTDLKFNTPDLGMGGKFMIPDARLDCTLEQDNNKMKNMANNISKNSVHLEGILHSCVTVSSDDQTQVSAKLEVCTASVKNIDGKPSYAEPIFHRVMVRTDGDNVDKLKQLEQECEAAYRKNMQSSDTPLEIASPVAVNGQIYLDDKGEPFILADKNNGISFPDTLKMANVFTMEGKILKAVANDSYASLEIETANDMGKINLPVTIFKENNPQKWSDIRNEVITKGQKVSAAGPLVSMSYGDGSRKIWRCVMNVKDINQIQQKKRQRKTNVQSL